MMLGDAGADLAAPSAKGFTALSAAFLNKNLTVAEIKPVIDYLLDNAEFGKVCFWSDQSFGAWLTIIVFELTLILYPDPRLTDSNGATPLHYAAAWGHASVMI